MSFTEVARSSTDRGELVLRRHLDPDGTEHLELRANGMFVMDTRETSTERALAARALALTSQPGHVLVGGLGLGFTVAEVLADSRVDHVTVVEIEGDLVGWLRDGTVPHGPALLTDPRVEVVVGDVAATLQAAEPTSYDVVLLDVDNGPGQLVHEANARLYDAALLAATRRALAPGGSCVVWSAERDAALDGALRDAFGHAEAASYEVDLQGRAERYWLHLARREATSGGG